MAIRRSTHNGQPVAPVRPVGQSTLERVLNEVHDHLRTYVRPADVEGGLIVLTLWIAHTHVAEHLFSTPRLLLDSPVPGAGKTTLLDHMERLCRDAILVSSITPAALSRVVATSVRTILIDEVDKVLDPSHPGARDLLVTVNTGYRVGGKRMVSTSTKNGDWTPRELSSFSPIVLSGISPHLPQDTRSRCIRVLFLPDSREEATETRWDRIDESTRDLGVRLGVACVAEVENLRNAADTEDLPVGVSNRDREVWLPLIRIADAAGGRWPQLVRETVRRYFIERQQELADIPQDPRRLLLGDLHSILEALPEFIPTSQLLARLARKSPQSWGEESPQGKPLTAQSLGRTLHSFGVSSERPDSNGPRGYRRERLHGLLSRMGYEPPG